MSIVVERNHLVRGADGVLYRIGSGQAEPVAESASVTPRQVLSTSVTNDYSAGRMAIEAGDYTAGRMAITPEADYSAGRMAIEAGDYTSGRMAITPDDDYASGRMTIDPSDDFSPSHMAMVPEMFASWRPSFTVDPSRV